MWYRSPEPEWEKKRVNDKETWPRQEVVHRGTSGPLLVVEVRMEKESRHGVVRDLHYIGLGYLGSTRCTGKDLSRYEKVSHFIWLTDPDLVKEPRLHHPIYPGRWTWTIGDLSLTLPCETFYSLTYEPSVFVVYKRCLWKTNSYQRIKTRSSILERPPLHLLLTSNINWSITDWDPVLSPQDWRTG